MVTQSSVTFRKSNVFSTKVPFGSRTVEPETKTEEAKQYWYVEAQENGTLWIQPLDLHTWLPTGTPAPISPRELQRNYLPEPEIYTRTLVSRFQKEAMLDIGQDEKTPLALDDTLVKAPSPQSNILLEKTARNDFENALSLAVQGDKEQAEKVFDRLLHAESLEKKHKHLFNEFGITLRKNNMYEHSITFYTRALELAEEDTDENLHLNLARSLHRMQRYMSCIQHIFAALDIAPGNKAALQFLAWMERQGVIPKQYHLDVCAKLKSGLAELAASAKAGVRQSQSTKAGGAVPKTTDSVKEDVDERPTDLPDISSHLGQREQNPQ